MMMALLGALGGAIYTLIGIYVMLWMDRTRATATDALVGASWLRGAVALLLWPASLLIIALLSMWMGRRRQAL